MQPYQAVATGQMTAIPGAGNAPPPGGSSSNTGLWVALAILGTIVVVGAVVAAVLLMTGSDTITSENLPASSTSSSTTSSTTQPATTGPATTAPTVTAAPPAPQPQTPTVGSLPGGLYCKDLAARGASYSDAVRYYKREGYPDRMDADGNGIPCETVYSAAEVRAYWGTVRTGSTLGLPSGLLCKDLHSRGLDYGSAVEYWIAEGFPDRMDADGNGIPCETVYSAAEVHAFWDTFS
ncbi:MAG: excalibur calcium-binding domain-containing protein [Acidimicrobiia bacterium]